MILADGNSWFSIGGFPPTSLLYGLRFRVLTWLFVVQAWRYGHHKAEITRTALYRRVLAQQTR
jgi:hypothetical protein